MNSSRITPERLIVVAQYSKRCHAARDGDCDWKKCPQGNGETRQTHCALDFSDVEDDDV